jgi:carbamoyl-phosphate synthase small subunit
VKPGLLVTADGAMFRGRSVGFEGVATGEVVFNTAMSGYQEIMTDPSYAGQIVTMTAPHIGNYGVNALDAQADRPRAVGMITRSISRMDSSWRSQGGFTDFLRSHGLIVLTDVDTRRLTRHVRDHGAMPAAVGTDVEVGDLVVMAAAAPRMAGRDLVSEVTTPDRYRVEPTGPNRGHVVAYDFGIKRDIIRAMTRCGAAVTVVPATTPADAVLALDADGVFLSNGPGDPEPLTGAIAAVRGLLGKLPIFGICLGHQILGLALGASTYKLPFGHHGGNHPVQRLADGGVEITAQNHGFAVDLSPLVEAGSEFGEVLATHRNLNDGTLEGLSCPEAGAFSVQYHPEAAPGPNDASLLFDEFIEAVTHAA